MISLLLFADGEGVRGFFRENWLVLLPCALGFVAIYLLMPRANRLPALWGGVLAGLALILGGFVLARSQVFSVETILFLAFSGLAIAAGVMMITQSNPVHAALSFAMVVLSVCGLFLLQAAPFLMAATIIIYAGAIVVTFLFVIMLAQQEGPSNADQRSREPFLASLAGCVLLASVWSIVHKTYQPGDVESLLATLTKVAAVKNTDDVKQVLGDPQTMKPTERDLPLVEQLRKHFASLPPDHKTLNDIAAIKLHWAKLDVDNLKASAEAVRKELEPHRNRQGSLGSDTPHPKEKTPVRFEPGKLPAGNVAAIGRTLFTDYLIPVELAATLLLVATIGAIVIAGRRSEELR
ncbi:MAG: hypothetical protein FJ303_05325 [Planctomycetes bacterium]|nr:hypothetical protein [Planctomycetota bacterium]